MNVASLPFVVANGRQDKSAACLRASARRKLSGLERAPGGEWAGETSRRMRFSPLTPWSFLNPVKKSANVVRWANCAVNVKVQKLSVDKQKRPSQFRYIWSLNVKIIATKCRPCTVKYSRPDCDHC
jgi:hypothetical protein